MISENTDTDNDNERFVVAYAENHSDIRGEVLSQVYDVGFSFTYPKSNTGSVRISGYTGGTFETPQTPLEKIAAIGNNLDLTIFPTRRSALEAYSDEVDEVKACPDMYLLSLDRKFEEENMLDDKSIIDTAKTLRKMQGGMRDRSQNQKRFRGIISVIIYGEDAPFDIYKLRTESEAEFLELKQNDRVEEIFTYIAKQYETFRNGDVAAKA